MTLRISALFCGLVVALAAVTPVGAAELFTVNAPASSLEAGANPAYAALDALDAASSPQWLRLHVEAVDPRTATLTFALDGVVRQAHRVSSGQLPDGSVAWSGRLVGAAEQDGSIELLRNAAGVTGIIKDGALYRIEPAGASAHLLGRDTVLPTLPRHHPHWRPHGSDVTAAQRRQLQDEAALASSAAADETSVLRVMVVTNTATWQRHGERIRNRALLGFAEGNRTYVDSRINARMELASFHVVGYPGRTMGEAFNHFMNPNTQGGRWAWAQRTADKADVIMIVMGNDYYCGVAPVGARQNNALMVVRYECLAGNDTVPHEMGHIHGSSHNPEQGGRPLYPWAWGRQVCNRGSGNWHSVMSYPCANRSARAQKWTSPIILHAGQPTGNAARFDNRRVMEENRARVAAFR
ncbi:M12 family metallo-peptidase [Stenotrophomonas sp. C3(2023)]|uniref:zinc-dependent metalloprotease family protein n=1 Tax=Stenotrophomonas sp. C3(2023) TaxID=3080277 RepID=UPI00293D05A4|nr:zinc-dependent metalloprotease family protein [Stenotrophomonas sp. C3(2023)]MDV3469432.1 M12 family metallo-peptidase [Stenotrophomonas sp. C3(2023)]